MTAMQSPENKRQNDLLAAFVACLHKTETTVNELADCYRACVDGGIDMSRFDKSHGRGFGMRLLKIAEGKLLAKPFALLLSPLDTVIERIATLPKETQKELWDSGLPILRKDGTIANVTLEDLSAAEARRAIDTTGGHGRVVPPKEQEIRSMPAITHKRDEIVHVRLTLQERIEIGALAHKRRTTIENLLRMLARAEAGLD